MENTERNENPEMNNADSVQEARMKEREMRRKYRRRMEIIRISIYAAVAVLVLAGIIVGGYFLLNPPEAEYSEYDAKYDKLAFKKQQLQAELDKLGPDMEKRLGNTSYMSFLFTTLDSALYTSAHPVMAEGSTDLVGILGLSPNELPGMEGKITVKEYETLIFLKWGTAIYWNGEGDLDEYLTTMETLLDEHEIDFPETVAFKNGVYRSEYDAVLEAHGIRNAIHNGEGGLAIRVEGDPEGIWHPGIVGWKAGMSATLLKRSVESEGGYALLEINFIATAENSAYSYFEIEGEEANTRLDSFRKMITLFKTSVNSKNIEVLTVEETRAKVEKYYSERTVIEIENAQKRAELNAQIAEVERQMTELYYEYNS
jgi:outer membrane murein-binding lipoprotein Lpp